MCYQRRVSTKNGEDCFSSRERTFLDFQRIIFIDYLNVLVHKKTFSIITHQLIILHWCSQSWVMFPTCFMFPTCLTSSLFPRFGSIGLLPITNIFLLLFLFFFWNIPIRHVLLTYIDRLVSSFDSRRSCDGETFTSYSKN